MTLRWVDVRERLVAGRRRAADGGVGRGPWCRSRRKSMVGVEVGTDGRACASEGHGDGTPPPAPCGVTDRSSLLLAGCAGESLNRIDIAEPRGACSVSQRESLTPQQGADTLHPRGGRACDVGAVWVSFSGCGS